jgi:hypothetical protein
MNWGLKKISWDIITTGLLIVISTSAAFASLKVIVKKNKQGFYCVQKKNTRFDKSADSFATDTIYYKPLPYKIVTKDTIYDITEYILPGAGTYFFLPDGTPVSAGAKDFKITYTKSEAFKAAERNAALEDELEVMHRQLQHSEKERQKEIERRKRAERMWRSR